MPRISLSALAAPRTALALALVSTAACAESAEHRRADSVNVAAVEQQRVLATRLSEQKDSLVSVVLDAEKFLGQVDSSISRVKGLPNRSKGKAQAEGVLQQQLEARKDLLFKVDALVKRAQSTARELAAAKRREAGLRETNATLRDSLGKDERLIAELGQTIQRQLGRISDLEGNVAQLTAANTKLGEELKQTLDSNARAYYVIGTEKELLQKGIIEREGGMNLLVAHPGRTVHAARTLDPTLFQHIDAREVTNILVPDPMKKYRIISRHSLDNAEVKERDKSSFKGHLKILDADRFWSSSRYLIVIEG